MRRSLSGVLPDSRAFLLAIFATTREVVLGWRKSSLWGAQLLGARAAPRTRLTCGGLAKPQAMMRPLRRYPHPSPLPKGDGVFKTHHACWCWLRNWLGVTPTLRRKTRENRSWWPKPVTRLMWAID